jgi:hypothetical protein
MGIGSHLWHVRVGPGMVVVIVLVALVNLSLLVFALLDCVNRKAVTGERKWVWIVVIVAFNFFGPLAYLAFGRRHEAAAVEDEPRPPGADDDGGRRSAAAVDLLYGKREEDP